MITRRSFNILCAAAGLLPQLAPAQRRRDVVVRTRIVVHPKYPIARVVGREVIVRQPRTAVVVSAPIAFLPVVTFAPRTVAVPLPPRERLVWEDTESIRREEDWVESNFGVDQRGNAIFLNIQGRAQLDFADVTFENGQVQAVDFNEREGISGLHQILDFRDGRRVKTVRLVARARSERVAFRLYLSR